MNHHIVIPARYASTRLKNKLLLSLAGKSVLQHTYERAVEADIGSVVIATDHEKIAKVANDFGAKVILTSEAHTSGTERVGEAAHILNIPSDDIVVNVQGDEPFIPADYIRRVAERLAATKDASMSTLVAPIVHKEEVVNANVVKVALNANHCVTYFSRAPIPYFRDGFDKDPINFPGNFTYYRHIGIYAYRADFLAGYLTWPASPWEAIEALEQLRVLYHGEKIKAEVVEKLHGFEINTLEDFKKAEAFVNE